MGLFWGTLSTYLIGSEADQEVAGNVIGVGDLFGPIPIGQYAALAGITTTMWVLGNLIVDRLAPRTFEPGRGEQIALALLVLALFVLMVLTVQALAAILVAVVGLSALGLSHLDRRGPPGPNIFSQFRPISLPNHLLLFLTPVVATFTYGVMVSHGWQVAPLLYAGPIAVAGAVMLVLSFLRPFLKPGAGRR
jgi:hypothetical protein